MHELRVVGVRVELPTNQPIVLLKEVEGDRFLPIWIGAVEATAIAYEQQGITPARPLTHDLLRDVLQALGASLEAVEINDMHDTVYYAELVFEGDVRVSSRPSDAIALALRTGAPVRCTEELLSESGITMSEAADDEVEKFREFLDNVTPEDFAE
ncbi:MAG TPA: bifunctional nuclease family protein [Candidatus Stackebrandtia excrementipullorum]|nr:bifunctional nuclease family protein [Candidatus Stackebrandtia excrementipullorum]